MRKTLVAVVVMLICTSAGLPQAKFSVHWEELTAAEFHLAIEQSRGLLIAPWNSFLGFRDFFDIVPSIRAAGHCG